MATLDSMDIELSRGSAVPTATAALRRVRQQFDGAVRAMKTAAYEAGRSLTQASNANRSVLGRDASKVERTVLARKAFHARADAEAEKYRAAYLGLAVKARENTVAALRAASGARREAALQRASIESEKAEALERAALKVDGARQNVGEPDVVSSAAVRRFAADAGVSLGPSGGVSSGGGLFSQGPLNVSHIMPEFFPEDVQRAASSLSGLGETADWWGAVRQSLGIGAASVGDAALRAGQEETKNNAAAGVAVAGVGGALQVVGRMLGMSFDAGAGGKAPPTEDAGFPWAPVLAGSLLLGGLWLVWRSA